MTTAATQLETSNTNDGVAHNHWLAAVLLLYTECCSTTPISATPPPGPEWIWSATSHGRRDRHFCNLCLDQQLYGTRARDTYGFAWLTMAVLLIILAGFPGDGSDHPYDVSLAPGTR